MSIIVYFLGDIIRVGGHYQRRGGGTQSASGYCPGRHYPLADSVRGTHLGGGGTVSAVTPGCNEA